MKIAISKIPGYFPDGYNEQFYINFRSINEGKDYFLAETEKKYRVKNDATYRNRKIQAVTYDKYYIEFLTTESIDIGLLKLADEVIIVNETGEIHNAEFIDFPEPEKFQNSEFRTYKLTYRDLNSKHTINYLRASSFSDGIIKARIGITAVYSPIYPIFDVTEFDRNENDDNMIKIVSSDNAFKTIEFIGYFNASTLFVIKSNLSAENMSNFYFEYHSVIYRALEVPELIVEDSEMEDLFPIRIILKWEQIKNYPYV